MGHPQSRGAKPKLGAAANSFPIRWLSFSHRFTGFFRDFCTVKTEPLRYTLLLGFNGSLSCLSQVIMSPSTRADEVIQSLDE
jgi:hypothetical protein